MRISARAGSAFAACTLLAAIGWGASTAASAPAPRAAATADAADTALTFPRFYESLVALAPDSARVAEVASVQIVRDAGVFVFERGTFALCRPVAGKTCAAVFSGRGTFLFTPPPGVERDQLERTFGRGPLRRNFQTLVLLFSDTTLSELSQITSFGPGAIPKSMHETLHDVLPFLVNTSARAVAPRIAKPLLDPVGDGLFLAAIGAAEGPLVFGLDPQEAERVELLRQPDNDRYGALVRHGLEIVNRFRASGDTSSVGDSLTVRETTNLEGGTRPPVRVRHAALHVVMVGADLGLRVTATLDLESAQGGQRWLPFQMPPAAVVESASWEGGANAPHWTWIGNPVMWVRCDPPLSAGNRRTLHVVYRASPLQRAKDLIYNDAALGWYPRLDRQSRSTFEMSFELPSHLQLAASGENASTATRGGITTSRWNVDTPVRFATFELGMFRRFELEPDSLPRLSVLLVDAHRAGQSGKLGLTGDSPRTPEQRLAGEVAGQAMFFRRAFGSLSARPLSAVEGTEAGVTSSPQLVRLPMIFESEPDQAEPPPFFRAREIARQWWGVETWPATSRDAWLCEGLANFSAAWCVQSGTRGTEAYLGLLESWRRQLVEQREALPGRTTPPSPLRLGARLDESPGSGTRTDGADQAHLVHQATWVIQMLRGLMLDPEDPDEHRFEGLLRSFYAEHRGGAIRTEAFRAAAERAAGRDLGWFFDQWVDHAAIPTYTFSYRVDKGADSRYVVRGRVRQAHVPPSFRMDVPVLVETESGAPARLRVQVQGPETEFELPAMTEKPVRVVFNDLGAVLCEVVTAPWE
jgi:hypothetical protein